MKANENEILTIAWERVEVRYENDYYEACGKCCFHNIFVTCNVRTLCHGCPCDKYSDDKNRRFAYFVRVEESANKPQTDANKNEHTREQKADFLQTNDADKAAEIRIINITQNEVRYIIDAIPGADGIFTTEEDAKRGLAIFKAGMLAERERLMKEAVEGEIVKDISGRLGATAKVNLDGFKFGEKVRVIIIKSK